MPCDLSIIIATYNRKDVLLATLQRLYALRNETSSAEIIVVDNASPDRTADAVADRFPGVQLVRQRRNLGSCAKQIGVDRAHGECLLFLDDDAFPRPGSLSRMQEHFRADARLATAGFRVHLPGGSEEAAALPHVFVGCGVGLRRAALAEVGGLDRKLFMQAEEYDLSFRLAAAGWQVRAFDDLAVDHLKSAQARANRRTCYYDTRNNLLIAGRYLPDKLFAIYHADWTQRYAALARRAGHAGAATRGRLAAAVAARRNRRSYHRWRLTAATAEPFFQLDAIADQMKALADRGVRRMLLASLGKNAFAFARGARLAGMRIISIIDDRFEGPAAGYRGIPLRSTEAGLAMPHDAVVVGETAKVHAARVKAHLRQCGVDPVQLAHQPSCPSVAQLAEVG